MDDPAVLDAAFEQAVTDGCEGLVCKSVGPDSSYQAGARGWQWIKLKRDYRTELSDTVDLVAAGAFAGRGRRAGVTRAAAGRLRPGRRTVPHRVQVRHRVLRRRPGRAARPARAAAAPHRPARVDARQEPDLWFEPGLVLEILSAELHLVPELHRRLGPAQARRRPAMRFPRFTGRWRDDKAPEDATTTTELVDLYRTARRAPAGS